MILEYHRPRTLEAALELLSRPQPVTRPLGGGTVLSRPGPDSYAVVDLQALGLDQIVQEGNSLQIGATVTLEQCCQSAALPLALRTAAHREISLNLRLMATLAGTLVSGDGRSVLSTLLMAIDARLVWLPGDREVPLGDWLPVRSKALPGKLISAIRLPSNTEAWFETVSRTPDDLPQVCVAAARWPSGRTRVVVGGFGLAPLLAMDGTEAGGAVEAVRNAFSQADDAWASAIYRLEAAASLVRRCLEKIGEL
jgi:CO/xanthine dehydrogenase FAD-binding subunit